jgi:hypothetical protein
MVGRWYAKHAGGVKESAWACVRTGGNVCGR